MFGNYIQAMSSSVALVYRWDNICQSLWCFLGLFSWKRKKENLSDDSKWWRRRKNNRYHSREWMLEVTLPIEQTSMTTCGSMDWLTPVLVTGYLGLGLIMGFSAVSKSLRTRTFVSILSFKYLTNAKRINVFPLRKKIKKKIPPYFCEYNAAYFQNVNLLFHSNYLVISEQNSNVLWVWFVKA